MLFANIIRFQGKIKKIIVVTFAQMAEIYLLAYLVILPFTLQFDTMVDGIGIAKYHSYFYQLLVCLLYTSIDDIISTIEMKGILLGFLIW